MKFELYKDGQGFWRWWLKTTNGEIIASGEGYNNRSDASMLSRCSWMRTGTLPS